MVRTPGCAPKGGATGRRRLQRARARIFTSTPDNIMLAFVRFMLLMALPLSLVACTTMDERVEHLIERLAANDIGSQEWEDAVDRLVGLGRPAARQLIAHLNPGHYKGRYYREHRAEQEKIRTGAARALGHIRPRGGPGALRERIGPAYTDHERIACIWAIGQSGFHQDAYDALLVQLEDEDPAIRLHTAIAIAKMDLDDGQEEIVGAVMGDEESQARIALQGLEESGFYTVPLLVRLASEPGPRQTQLEEVVDRVTSRLQEQLNADDSFYRQRSARALGVIGDPTVVDDLLSLLDDNNNLVRFNAAAALASMDHQRGIQYLFAALDNEDPILRVNAVRFLTEVQERGAAVESALIEALSDPSPLARAGAARVLGQARVDAAVDQLVTATRDTSADVRRNAVIALGMIGSPAGVDRIRELDTDPDGTVAYYAGWALAQLERH